MSSYINNQLIRRQLNLLWHFKDDTRSNNFDSTLHIPNLSTFNPQPLNNPILSAVNSHLSKIPNRPLYQNPPSNLLTSLTNIRKKENLSFCKADKSCTLIIMNTDDYNDMVYTHLHDRKTYKQIPNYNIKYTTDKIFTLIEKYKHNLSDSAVAFLTFFQDFHTSNFYILPKIHKCPEILNAISSTNSKHISLPFPTNLSSRPIVSSHLSPTSRLSKFLNNIFQNVMTHIPSYISNSYDFINTLPKNVSDHSTLVTLDVISLYTNIPNELGYNALIFWYNKLPSIFSCNLNFILESLQIILEHNFFTFLGDIYLQTYGVAMGTSVAPTYANLVLGYIEFLFVNSSPFLSLSSRKYFQSNFRRYIDDGFIIWPKTFEPLPSLLHGLNSIHPDIQFTINFDKSSITFLDVKIININNILETDIFYKPTHNFLYINFNSNYPRHIRTNIPYALSKRICRIVSKPSWKIARLQQLSSILLGLNYPASLINDAFQKNICSNSISKPRKDKPRIPFISDKFSNTNKHLTNMLAMDPFFSKFKLCPISRKPRNLLTFLKTPNRCLYKVSKCHKPRCLTCQHLRPFEKSICINNQNIFINKNSNCASSYVIYILYCNNCPDLFYIGKSQTKLQQRMNLHRSHVNACTSPSTLPVTRHLKSCPPISYSVSIIYHLVDKKPNLLKFTENYFIALLKPPLNVK